MNRYKPSSEAEQSYAADLALAGRHAELLDTAVQRAEIGVRGYDDRIYRRKAKAKPHIHALTADAERLLTLRETHRLNDIPAVTFEPSPLMGQIIKA